MKQLYFCILLISVVFTSSCSTSQVANSSIDEVRQLNYLDSKFKRLPISEPIEEWDIDEKVKSQITVALNKRIDIEASSGIRYRVQTIAYLDSGVRYIWFNGFCSSFYQEVDEYWKEIYVGIIDSGHCSFEDIYLLESDQVVEFTWGVSMLPLIRLGWMGG